LIWGYNWVVMKVAIQYSSPFFIQRCAFFWEVFVYFLSSFGSVKPVYPKEIPGTFFAGVLQMCGIYGLSTWALVTRRRAGKTAFINYTMPFWVLILAWLLLEERLNKAGCCRHDGLGTLCGASHWNVRCIDTILGKNCRSKK